jgi:glycopeptide antibiotics resistance protein
MLIEFNGTAWLVGVCALAVLLLDLRPRGRYYLFFFAIFGVYLIQLVSVVLFPFPLPDNSVGFHFGSVLEQLAFMQAYRSLNLIPFYFGDCWENSRACASGIIENILMTIPFGLGIRFVVRLRPRDFVWLPAALGLTLESAQLALDLWAGGAYRAVDTNDVLFNALGVWIGYGLFRVFAWFYLWAISHLPIRPAGLWAYLADLFKANTSDVGHV